MKPYRQLLITLLISYMIMYGVMFLNVDQADHIYLSTTRMYMALLMVLPMTILMILSMRKMYSSKRLNIVIISGSTVAFFAVLLLLRSQTFVKDREYMKGMISHHSSAIMTSKNATITDPDVKRLSEHIIESQQKEIAEMKNMLKRMK